MKILFVCTAGRQRSPTAADLYSERGHKTQYAGIHAIGKDAVTQKKLDWADVIVTMEDVHREFIERLFPKYFREKTIQVLHIPDMYENHDPELEKIILRQMSAIDIV